MLRGRDTSKPLKFWEGYIHIAMYELVQASDVEQSYRKKLPGNSETEATMFALYLIEVGWFFSCCLDERGWGRATVRSAGSSRPVKLV